MKWGDKQIDLPILFVYENMPKLLRQYLVSKLDDPVCRAELQSLNKFLSAAKRLVAKKPEKEWDDEDRYLSRDKLDKKDKKRLNRMLFAAGVQSAV